jgi:hypothetical protein
MRTPLAAFLLSFSIIATDAVAGQPATVADRPVTVTNGIHVPTPVAQESADEYTRYELLAPGSGRFRIHYEVTAITPGARYFYNPIRKGSAASDEKVLDAATGRELAFEVVSGTVARKDALMSDADPDTDYIKVTLPRKVPAHGQARLVILKTYEDPKSYFPDGRTLVFDRPLGVKRNKVVLPAGYQLTSLSVPSQIGTENDGRIAISFMHAGAGTAPLVLRAAPGAQTGKAAVPRPPTRQRSWESPFEGGTEEERLAERAHQDRRIVYFLQRPDTHAFALYHDYTETRPGVNAYANVVRKGSVVSNPSAVDLDTGEQLVVKEMSGAEMTAAKIDAGVPVDPAAKVVVIAFEPVEAGRTRRLRITETYTAPASYRLDGDDLVFDRILGRPRNAVVLPSGWYVTFSGAPATVSQLPDGRVWLDYWNDRPQALDVLLKARRRTGPD